MQHFYFLNDTPWIGILVLLITGIAIWACWPRGGRTHRFVGTEFEPYVAVAMVCGIAIGGSMVLSWALGS